MPITASQVKPWMHLQGTDQDAQIEPVIAAVNAFVGSLPVVTDHDGDNWPAQVQLAAIMLAARLIRRRNSPSGVEALTEAGTSYVSRYDPDIARMLELDGYERPAIA